MKNKEQIEQVQQMNKLKNKLKQAEQTKASWKKIFQSRAYLYQNKHLNSQHKSFEHPLFFFSRFDRIMRFADTKVIPDRDLRHHVLQLICIDLNLLVIFQDSQIFLHLKKILLLNMARGVDFNFLY